ncbi:hypothetical protein CAL26_05225 [Bordetella genomosp. 9]|uniref:Uncharacterized protein n=1 Tax=Bordetella genomosp. 9 TaxID=1416803 RepID=A0A261RP33_9BORD|nr:hypothetical protein CAL26_05225 [Bordetella genomosp. 9]
MWKSTLLPCLLVLLLASCSTNGQPQQVQPVQPEVQVKTRIIDTGCDWTKPIFVDKGDVLSDGTAKQILAHNLAGARNCGWKPRS